MLWRGYPSTRNYCSRNLSVLSIITAVFFSACKIRANDTRPSSDEEESQNYDCKIADTKEKPFRPGPIICRDGNYFTVVSESNVLGLRSQSYRVEVRYNPNLGGISSVYIDHLSYQSARKVILERLLEFCESWLRHDLKVNKFENAVKAYGAIAEMLTTEDQNEKIQLSCNRN